MSQKPTQLQPANLGLARLGAAIVLVAFTFGRANASGISPGQVDTFENGTSAGWTSGGDTFDSPLPTGGPAGASDHFISANSGTYGGKSRWVIFNTQQWTGDYLSAGVTAIGMDLLNQDPTTPFSVRLALLPGLPGGSGTPGFVSNTPVVLPPDGQWHHEVFTLSESAMTLVNPSDPPQLFSDVLSAVSELRLFVNAGATPTSVIGDDNTNAKIGLDNITAISAPKPVAGDFDLNGVRNAADVPAMLTALTDLNHFKTTNQLDDNGLLAIGDVNSDGKVNNADLQSLLNVLHAGGGSIAAVPEPATLSLAVGGFAALAWIVAKNRSRSPSNRLT
jgi:hypothetical protein